MRENEHGEYDDADKGEEHVGSDKLWPDIIIVSDEDNEADTDGKQQKDGGSDDRPSLPRRPTSDGRQYSHEHQNKADTNVAICPLCNELTLEYPPRGGAGTITSTYHNL